MNHITAHASPIPNASSDFIKWKYDVAENFSTSKTYKHFIKITVIGVSWSMQKVWKADIPQCIHMFIWLLLRDCLLTNEVRTKKSMCDVPCCDLCEEVIESALHAIRDCASARQIWHWVVPRQD